MPNTNARNRELRSIRLISSGQNGLVIVPAELDPLIDKPESCVSLLKTQRNDTYGADFAGR